MSATDGVPGDKPASARAVLVTGATGQVGTELQRSAWPEGWRCVALSRQELDLTDSATIARIVANGHDGAPWAAVINAGAYTAVDKAESEPLTAWQVNAMAPVALAQSCAAAGIPVVHVSTDYVFSGTNPSAWEVDDPVCPLNVYGASKLGGELALRTSGARHAIVRTAWVISPHGANFVKTMLRLAADRCSVSVVDDQWGSPTSAADLAEVLIHLAVTLADDPQEPSGIFHFSNSGKTSWAGFAEEIFRQSALRGGPSADVLPIPTSAYPTPARRPANSMLSHSALAQQHRISPRPWQDALAPVLDTLIGEVL